MSSQVVFYDLPSKIGSCWSLNPWKTRLVLNYKGIPYKTEWTEYPDLAPKFKSLGIPAAQGKMPYTSPTVTLPDGRHVMGSEKIAPELERLRPEPSLHVDDPMTEKATAAVGEFFGALVPLLLPRVPKRLLNPSSAEYFEETRKGWFGMPLSELEQSKGAKEAWEKAQPGAEKIKGLLKQRTEGPFVHGEQVTYADFIIVGSFEFIKLLGDDVYEKAMSLDPAFPKLYEACKPWLKRSDH